MTIIDERVLRLADTERMPNSKLNTDDKAKVYCYNQCKYMKEHYYYLTFFRIFFTIWAGHIKRLAGGIGRGQIT